MGRRNLVGLVRGQRQVGRGGEPIQVDRAQVCPDFLDTAFASGEVR